MTLHTDKEMVSRFRGVIPKDLSSNLSDSLKGRKGLQTGSLVRHRGNHSSFPGNSTGIRLLAT